MSCRLIVISIYVENSTIFSLLRRFFTDENPKSEIAFYESE